MAMGKVVCRKCGFQGEPYVETQAVFDTPFVAYSVTLTCPKCEQQESIQEYFEEFGAAPFECYSSEHTRQEVQGEHRA